MVCGFAPAYAIAAPLPQPLLYAPLLVRRPPSTRRPRRRARSRARIHALHQPSNDDGGRAGAPLESERVSDPQESYLQCVECAALYAVEPEELEGSPRVVGCSACLHEWYATEEDLLWGEDDALAALATEGSFEKQARREKEMASRKAVSAAEGMGGVEVGRPRADAAGTQGAIRKRIVDRGSGGSGRAEKEEWATRGARRKVQPSGRAAGGGDEERELEKSTEKGVKRAGGVEERFNVFVGNLAFRATEEDLYRAFSGYGAVLKCQVPADASGASKGYGFVEMKTREAGLRAIKSLQGTSILGRDVSLNEARPRRESSSHVRRQTRGSSLGKEGRRSRSA